MPLESEELRRARLLEAVEPALQLPLDRDRVQLVPALASLAANEDDPRAFEHAEVLHDRETRELGEPSQSAVVVSGPSRRASRIARRCGELRAFHTRSS